MTRKSEMSVCGVYEIVNRINGHSYIGSSEDIRNRKDAHLGLLRRSNHHSQHLQSAYNLYGESYFDFVVIVICEKYELLRYEQFLIDSRNPVYNVCRVAASTRGVRKSEETRRKISNSKMGHIVSEESRRKLSEKSMGNKRCLGRKVSQETRDKISLSLIGKKRSEEQKLKISLASLGRKHSEETRIKISKNNRKSDAGRERIRQSKLGNKWNVGRRHSEKTKEKMRLAWARRKLNGN